MANPVYSEGTKIGGNLQHVHMAGGTNGAALSIGSCTTSTSSTTVTLGAANAAIAVGMLVTSAHLEIETYVVSYNSSGPTIVVSRLPKTASSGGATLVFSNQYDPGRDDGFGLIAGSGITLAAASDAGTGRTNFTITSTSGSGSVGITGTPAADQIGVWTSSTAMEGDADFTYSATTGLAVGQSGTNSGAVADLKAFSDTSGNYLHWDSSEVTLGLVGQSAKLHFYDVGGGEYISTNNSGLLSINAGGNLDLNGATLTMDSTDTTNLTMTAANASNKTMTIAASNSGDGNGNISMTADGTFDIDAAGAVTIDGGSITIGGDSDVAVDLDASTFDVDASTSVAIDCSNTSNGVSIATATSGVPVSIGHTTSEVTVNDNLTVTGDLTVNGTTTTVNSTTIQLDDKNIELANGVGNDAAIDGGGITLISSGDNKTFTYVNSNTAWTSSENFDIASGKKYMINGTAVFESATELTSTVVTSGLTTVGALNSGSITSGFGTIDTGSSTISTTGTLTGGAIVGTSLAVTGTITGDTSLTLDSTTLTTAELGVLDGVSAGTVTASKALVVDSNKDIASVRNLTGTGKLKGGTLSADDIAVIDTSSGTASNLANAGTQEIAQFDWGDYRTVKYVGQVTDGTDVDAFEILVTWGGHATDAQNAAASVDITTYAYVSSDSALGDISTTVDSDNINIIFTNNSGGTISSFTYDLVATHLAKQ